MKSLFILLILIGFTEDIYSQKQTDTQSLLWIRYSFNLKMNKKWEIKQELEERAYWFPWRQHQFLSRTSLNRKLNNGWNTAIGFTYLRQSLPHNPFVNEITNTSELRPQIELGYKQKISDHFSTGHRYWSEFRFIEQANNQLEFENIRMRYRLELQYLLSNKVTLKGFDEIFLNVGNKIVYNVFDQNRYGASVQYMPINNFGFEIGYFNWFQQKKSGNEFYNRNIVRFTVFHNIALNKT